MPIARTPIAVMLNAGDRQSARAPYTPSWRSCSRKSRRFRIRHNRRSPQAEINSYLSRYSLRQLTIGTMKILRSLHWFTLFGTATAFGFLISVLPAATPEEQAVLAPVQALFDGMAKRDAEAIRK